MTSVRLGDDGGHALAAGIESENLCKGAGWVVLAYGGVAFTCRREGGRRGRGGEGGRGGGERGGERGGEGEGGREGGGEGGGGGERGGERVGEGEERGGGEGGRGGGEREEELTQGVCECYMYMLDVPTVLLKPRHCVKQQGSIDTHCTVYSVHM